MEQHVIIVAGGKGLRMGTTTPKQFLEINGKAIIIHTIEKFKQALPHARLVLVLPQSEITRWEELKKPSEYYDIPCVPGGNTRFQSVKAGLSLIPKGATVGIHDAVRPLVNVETITSCFAEAKITGAAIPVVNLKDSIRKVENGNSIALNRAEYRLVQTPQCFNSDLLLLAYQQIELPSFTDDASVIESHGKTISLVEGNTENIKITEPADLKLVELLLKD